jgi:Protein of unknown function (DUF2690)
MRLRKAHALTGLAAAAGTLLLAAPAAQASPAQVSTVHASSPPASTARTTTGAAARQSQRSVFEVQIARRRVARVLTISGPAVSVGASGRITIGGGTAIPAPAVGRPGAVRECSGSGCNGDDPVGTGCATGGYPVSGYTIPNSKDDNYGTINLMYQNTCAANWAEANDLAGGVYIQVYNTQGKESHYQPNYNWGYTNMVDGAGINAGTCIFNSARTTGYCLAQSGSYPASIWSWL